MKIIKLLLTCCLIIGTSVFSVHAIDDDISKKEKLLSYGLYSTTSQLESINSLEDITVLSYIEIKNIVRSEVIVAMNEFANGTILWDPSFVLELAPVEYPELYSMLYSQLLSQGFNPQTGIVGEFKLDSQPSLFSSIFSRSVPYTYIATGHGTVISCDSTINWSMDGTKFAISSLSSEFTGGWSGINKSTSIRNNNSTSAYGFYNYTALKDAYSYQANVQLKVTPTASGYATLTILTKDVYAIGIGFSSEN